MRSKTKEILFLYNMLGETNIDFYFLSLSGKAVGEPRLTGMCRMVNS